MDDDELKTLSDVIDFYRSVTVELGIECKLDATRIEDTLARLRSGEYKIVENPDY